MVVLEVCTKCEARTWKVEMSLSLEGVCSSCTTGIPGIAEATRKRTQEDVATSKAP